MDNIKEITEKAILKKQRESLLEQVENIKTDIEKADLETENQSLNVKDLEKENKRLEEEIDATNNYYNKLNKIDNKNTYIKLDGKRII